MSQILENKAILKYKEVAIDMLRLSFPTLSFQEINEAVDYSIIKRCKNSEAVIDNNYKKVRTNTTLMEISDYILSEMPILTAYGVLFQRHDRSKNPIAKMVDSFINTRKAYKKTMFQYLKGSEMFERYNLLQLLAKIDANGLYGVLIWCIW